MVLIANLKARYLKDQYYLLSIKSSDVMTEQELTLFRRILELKNLIESTEAKEEKDKLVKQRKDTSQELNKLFKEFNGVRKLNPACVCDTRSFKDGSPPAVITWDNLKPTRKIQEFCNEESRILNIPVNGVYMGKVVIEWKSKDIIRQMITKGFFINDVHYSFHTASAGQLRTSKCSFLEDSALDKMWKHAYAGMTVDKINEHGGINVSKLMAYLALPCSATERWKMQDGSYFDIDKAIVVKDFEADVTDRLEYINEQYINDKRIQTVKINHCDGIGMIDPDYAKMCDPPCDNFITRGPWCKGLITSFDFLKFCRVNNCPAVVTDVWGTVHDLIKEDIKVIFTESQLKLWKYYTSWNEYKAAFKDNNCYMCRTNYEENWIKDSPLNYQFEQALIAMTDEEIKAITTPDLERINNLGTTKQGMLQVLGAESLDKAKSYSQKCLNIYPPLLRDEYYRETIKDVKKAWTLNAKSGVLNLPNKRLYAIPDMYAACQRWFQGIEQPEGILPNGIIWTCEKSYNEGEEVDVLRSPSLYMEHAIRTIASGELAKKCKEWFKTKGVYAGTHDLISRILQFDVDGDMLNLCKDPNIINAAKETIKQFDIVPLYYEGLKAKPNIINNETFAMGIIRSQEGSNIGEISNGLSKLWNKDSTPDIMAASWMCFMNNLVINEIVPLWRNLQREP